MSSSLTEGTTSAAQTFQRNQCRSGIIFFVWTIVTALAATGSALVAGILTAFSLSVMPALRVQPAPAAMATMKRINVDIVGPTFLALFLGTVPVSIAAAVGAWFSSGPDALAIAGAVLYVVGVVGVTVAVNVPMNNTLAAVDPVDAENEWPRYAARWTRWNHVRCAAGAAASFAFTASAIAL